MARQLRLNSATKDFARPAPSSWSFAMQLPRYIFHWLVSLESSLRYAWVHTEAPKPGAKYSGNEACPFPFVFQQCRLFHGLRCLWTESGYETQRRDCFGLQRTSITSSHHLGRGLGLERTHVRVAARHAVSDTLLGYPHSLPFQELLRLPVPSITFVSFCINPARERLVLLILSPRVVCSTA